jgi:hypothetical protein
VTVRSARARLVACANPDGGFGAAPGLPSQTEATALAALALAGDGGSGGALEGAQAWLGARQHADGSWPLLSELDEPSWATSHAVLALARLPGGRERALRGARWLLDREGRRPGALESLVARLRGRARILDQDARLRGWPWAEGASAWVEPTAWALLALKAVRRDLGGGRVGERIDEGERLLLDRVCPEGGWNYGNAAVFGEALDPYPDTTALALLALRERPLGAVRAASLAALRRELGPGASVLALALGALCLGAYGEEPGALPAQLEAALERPSPWVETRALALAALAQGDGARIWREPA